ncbi:alpha/beta-hydrolase [Aspergillus japonicus CBS 114.51]|uniref:Alpha/beta-hydrolase n=1 Tax=Aspergillus japonicus CBS 114.51 TaxID=1448312 RepID=A0A8T8WJ66_ASPJA|nr:alpha/beta-hydrolase [Aspergillus japonicus CBS 114.51]RAH75754.1 alpha/beta-hydrolase [Aspergillus japonicus CBS 114.51]
MIFRYAYLKCVALLLRTLTRIAVGHLANSSPDEIVYLPSRDAGRPIKAHIYHPQRASEQRPSAVLLNFHGSGFVLPGHGSDDQFCRFIATRTNYTVLDIQYRLAPEHPFPAAFQDIEDTVKYVHSHPTIYDVNAVALSGFSAGANLALAVSSASMFPANAFSAVVSFYGPADLAQDPADKQPFDNTGKKMPACVSRYFHRCYIQPNVDRKIPGISPSYTPPEKFPAKLLFITASQDSFAPETEDLARKISILPGRQVSIRRFENCPHGWDKGAQEGTVLGKARNEAYELAARFLLE